MPERNRAVQRTARRTGDRHKTGSYTEVRTAVRRGLRQVPMPPCPAMLESTVWSRYGRWAFGTDDWQQWTFRTGCGHLQSPPDVATAGLDAPPELALTQCLRHGPGTDPAVCPPPGTAGTPYYKVFWWHANTPVFPFAAGPFVLHGPLTKADDIDVVVPGITRPLAHTEV